MRVVWFGSLRSLYEESMLGRQRSYTSQCSHILHTLSRRASHSSQSEQRALDTYSTYDSNVRSDGMAGDSRMQRIFIRCIRYICIKECTLASSLVLHRFVFSPLWRVRWLSALLRVHGSDEEAIAWGRPRGMRSDHCGPP